MKTRVFIDKNPLFYGKVVWFLYLIKLSRNIQFDITDEPNNADVTIGPGRTFPISIAFYDRLSINLFDHSVHFKEYPFIQTEEGEKDIISTVFYLVNCLQEYHAQADQVDALGRFKKEVSVQDRFGFLADNYVQSLIDDFLTECGIAVVPQKSKVYISHDIDMLTSGFRQEFVSAVKKGQIVNAFNFFLQRIRGESPWNNIKDVSELDVELGVKSTFYWLNYQEVSLEGIENADYSLKEKNLAEVENLGLINGLHKSVMTYTIRKEVGDFPVPVYHNRYHFLKYSLPQSWDELEKTPIKTDASLGYSRGINFRNSFGLPFYPYNLEYERPYNTLIVPLQIMDVSLECYKSKNRHEIVKEVMDFINKNNNDCLISILWHNNELTEYSNKHMREAYKDIVDILKESSFEILSIEDVLNKYG